MTERKEPRQVDALGQRVADLSDAIESLNVQVTLLLAACTILTMTVAVLSWRVLR